MANGWTRTRTHSPLIRVAANDNDITTVAIFFLRSYQPSAVCVWQSHRFYRKRSFWCYAVGPLSVSFISVAVVGFVVYLSFCWLGRSLSLVWYFFSSSLPFTVVNFSAVILFLSTLFRSGTVTLARSRFSLCLFALLLVVLLPLKNDTYTDTSIAPDKQFNRHRQFKCSKRTQCQLNTSFSVAFFSSNRLLLADKVTRLNGK